ncbi:hypothetical protein [Bosea beijingensis]|uniref:hypothetical protein n=1 Tax=Bosea beijingensis TaxID=3068632 RepID=UPI002741332C|nr:hypothetical protein [Bosea sp. REN20]
MGSISNALSSHAQARLQQRAVPPLIVDLLERFGSSSACGHGAERYCFDKPAIRRLRQHLGGKRSLKVIERWLGVYAVVGDNGRLVTVGHQTARFSRP